VPPGIPQSFDEHIKLMFELLALGFQADITRVGTLLFARDLTGRVYPQSESPTLGFHGGSHHGEDPQRINDLSKINQYHVKMLAHFADKLAGVEEGDGTLLDHSLLLFGSNMGNPNQHLHYDVPHVILGGNQGRMKGGRIEVGAVGKHELRRFSSELETDALQIALSRILHQQATDRAGAGECDHVDVHVQGERLTGFIAEARDDV